MRQPDLQVFAIAARDFIEGQSSWDEFSSTIPNDFRKSDDAVKLLDLAEHSSGRDDPHYEDLHRSAMEIIDRILSE